MAAAHADGVSHRAIEGGAVEDDPFENQTYSTRLGAAFLDDGRIDLRVRSYRGDTAVDGFGAEDLNAMAAQDQWSITDNVHVTAAVRGDEHSTFGSETSHRVTLSGDWSDGRGRVHGSYGTAFRAPNFNELYFPFSGDPNLLPETTEGFDIGVEQRFGDSGVTFDLTW